MNPEELRTRQQVRDFAHQLDAASFILRRLGFPVHKLRDVVDGLQGAAGGRPGFEMSFLSLARRLRHTGKDETAETYAQRKVAALDKAQRKGGRMLFTIHRGGGVEHRRTRYVDHLTPVANWMMQRARESELWAKHPARAIESFVEEAVEMLPPAPEEGRQGQDALPLDDDLYIQRMINQGINFALKACDRAAEIGVDDIAVARMAAERLLRYAADRHSSRAGEGVQICTPSGEPEDSGRGTNLYPSAAKPPEEPAQKPEMRAAALGCAARGLRVFPLHWIKPGGACSCPAGANCDSPGKHPRISLWQKLACSDEKMIRGWWRQWPEANVGVVTGEAAGLYVVDVDLKSGGDISLMELCERAAVDWPDTLTVLTGSGGFHYYFQFPSGLDLRNTGGRLGRGIDTRGNGGFVVAPPSLHASGSRYVWVNDLAPAPLPEPLLKLLTEAKGTAAPRPAAKARSQARSGPATGAVITEGGRNEALFRIGCSLRGRGAEAQEIEAELSDINERRCSPPLRPDEVQKIARSCATYAANRVAAGA